MNTPITQDRIYEDRVRRLKIALLQWRIDRCMKTIERASNSSDEQKGALGKLMTLVAQRNALYTDSELRQKALERGLA